jgi:hypothetical protein
MAGAAGWLFLKNAAARAHICATELFQHKNDTITPGDKGIIFYNLLHVSRCLKRGRRPNGG